MASEDRLVELWLDLVRDRFVERIESSRGEEMTELVEGDAGVERDRHEQCRDQRLPADKNEPKDLGLEDLRGGQREDRRNEGDVERNQDVVGDDPTFLEGGPLDPVLLVHTQS